MSNKIRFLRPLIGLIWATPLTALAASDSGQSPATMAQPGLAVILAISAVLAVILWAWYNRMKQARLLDANARVETVLNAIPDAVIQLSAAGVVNYLNPAGEAMLGNEAGMAAPWHFIDHATRSPLLAVLLAQADKEGLIRLPAGARLINRFGLEMEVEGSCQPLRDEHGQTDGYLLQLRDVSEESEWRRQQPDLWDRDPVSSLPGHSFMADRMNRALQNRRAADRPMTYLYISFTGIRAIYDKLGSQAGDTLVRHLTALIRTYVRDTDLIARMDEENFAVLLTFCPAEIGQRIAQGIQGALQGFSFEWENINHPVQGKLGQVDIPPFDGGVDELLAVARPE